MQVVMLMRCNCIIHNRLHQLGEDYSCVYCGNAYKLLCSEIQKLVEQEKGIKILSILFNGLGMV